MKIPSSKLLPLLMTLFFMFTMLAAPASAKSTAASEKQKTEKADKKKSNKKKAEKKKSEKSKKDSKKNTSIEKKKNKKKADKKVTIKSNDPKAFTKSILYELDGTEVEFVDLNSMTKKAQKQAKAEADKKAKEEAKEAAKKKAAELEAISETSDNPDDYFDFSTMLIPVTHEAHLGSPYGIRDHRLHRGVDVQVVKEEPMVAAYPGKVIVSKYNKGGYGHYVIVEHENGLQTLYGHLAERSVKVGELVYPGDIVGLAGNTGKSSGAHLHFEIRYGEVNIDPVTVIDFPHWQLKPGVERYSKKKAIQAHRKMQAKLKLENVYIVRQGDTVADVAEYFYISEDAVRRINHLSKDEPLKVGQRLKGSL